MTVTLHPSIDGGVAPGSADFQGGVLSCRCENRLVKVRISSQIAHNHACGCTKCWKPESAKFSVVAVVPSERVEVLENGDKLKVIDKAALIQRHACTVCGVHLHGPVAQPDHPFNGLSFIHPELFEQPGAAEPTFAAFVSSVIEGGGAKPDEMGSIRSRLLDLGLPPYDCLSPGLMDYIATFLANANRVLPKD